MSHSSDSSSPTKGSSPSAGSVAKHNIHNPCHRTKPTSNPITSGSPYGELIVAEILAAKDLAAGDFIQGESDPYVVVRFDDKEKQSAACTSTLNPVYNERFVFWVPSSPTIDEQHVSITVRNKNMVTADEHLGEVHLSLAIPVNEAFDEWYPLVKEDGSKKGSVRVGVRRMVLTSPSLLLAAQSLAAAEGSLDDDDLAAHGSTIPELWYGFAEAQEPMDVDEKPKQTDMITSKLNHLSRRLIGIELTSSSSEAKRNVF
uniref:C2 domain-containing protein n=1 Tax=Globisporangium ultimum (strain ATCC 200006 / CBS 805.95 / DAOM BR144) TaxID=431595 RepID=K3X091_GLOUD